MATAPLSSGSRTPSIPVERRLALEAKVEEAKKVIQDSLDQFGLDQLAISFNGGKDCTLLLHLLVSLLPQSQTQPNPLSDPTSLSAPTSTHGFSSSHTNSFTANPPTSSSSSSFHPPIKAIYITGPSPFDEVESFVDRAAYEYNLDLVRLGGGMKTALGVYLDDGSAPADLDSEVWEKVEGLSREDVRKGKGKGRGVKGVLVGTRRNDPHGADLSLVQPTDPSWPQFLRIHPILNWSYTDVWDYLREYEIPWCSLYDEGFTSLGSRTNTHPNPALLIDTAPPPHSSPSKSSLPPSLPQSEPPRPAGLERSFTLSRMYKPAWMLEDDSLERAGRGADAKKS